MKLASSTVLNPIKKNLPHANNLIGAGVVGIGGYKIARFLDGMLGNRIQSIGIGLPLVGNLSLLDLIMLLSFKATMRKNTWVAAAFAGDRIFNLAQNPSSLLSLGGFASNVTSVSPVSGSPGGGI